MIDRKARCFEGDVNLKSIESLPSATVLVNPKDTSAAKLLEILESDQQTSGLGEKYKFHECYPTRYESNLKWTYDDDLSIADISIIFVAFVESKVVGFLNLEVSLRFDYSDDMTQTPMLTYVVNPHVVYVLSQERGKGYGFDLSVTCSDIACGLLYAVYDSVQDGSKIHTVIECQYESQGGEEITRYLKDSLVCIVEDLSENDGRDRIEITGVELDGGW